MGFRETERRRKLAGDPTLHASLEDSALKVFRDHGMKWWGRGAGPTESPISSQVACVNHLELARLDREVALAVVRSQLPNATTVFGIVDEGFVGFEWIRDRNAMRTSLDAVMVGGTADHPTLVLIEWKYTETRPSKSVAVSENETSRVDIYRHLLDRDDSPISLLGDDVEAVFYEPER